MTDKPILTPLAELFSSRKFLLVFVIVAVAFLVHLVPELRPYSDDLTKIVFIAAGYLVLHLSAEDLLGVYQAGKVPTGDALQELVRAIIQAYVGGTTTSVNPGSTITINQNAAAPGGGDPNGGAPAPNGSMQAG